MSIPYGYCHCGCGAKTRIADRTRAGRVKGEPVRWLPGHHQRPDTARWIVEDSGYTTPCWIWQWGLDRRGYARWREHEREGHIVTWEQTHGPVPAGLELDHLCRNRACVNPAHLEPVTHTENLRRGARTLLTVAQVREIRASDETPASLSLRFGVDRSTIYAVRQRKSWKDVA